MINTKKLLRAKIAQNTTGTTSPSSSVDIIRWIEMLLTTRGSWVWLPSSSSVQKLACLGRPDSELRAGVNSVCVSYDAMNEYVAAKTKPETKQGFYSRGRRWTLRGTYLGKLTGNDDRAAEGSPSSGLCIPGASPYLPPLAQASPTWAKFEYMPNGFWSGRPTGAAADELAR